MDKKKLLTAIKRLHIEDETYYLTKGFYKLGLDWGSPEAKPNLTSLKKDAVIADGVPFVSPAKTYYLDDQER